MNIYAVGAYSKYQLVRAAVSEIHSHKSCCKNRREKANVYTVLRIFLRLS